MLLNHIKPHYYSILFPDYSTSQLKKEKTKANETAENAWIGPLRNKYKLENVHLISIPVHIGDPIGLANGDATWRVMFEKIIGLLISVPPLARCRYCVLIQVSPLLMPWQRITSEVDSWKTVHPSAKVIQEG